MKILVVSQYFWPETFRINEIVSDLVARGHDVVVLTGTPNYPAGTTYPDYRAAPQDFARHHGADIVRVPIVSRGQTRWQLVANYASFVASALVLGTWRLRNRPFDAILVCQLSPVTSAIPAMVLRRIKRAPVTMWVLDLWPESLAAVGAVESKAVLAAVGALVGSIYRRCDHILVQSRAFIPMVQKRAPGTPVSYFPAWAEAAFDSGPDAVALAPEVAPYRDTFNVMFAGNIGEAQDFPAILSAAEFLRDSRDICWLIVGDGRALETVRSEITRRGLQSQVILLGRHPIERMPSFFKAAGALLVSLKADPALAMTIPGKAQSYLQAGLPIVAMLDGEGSRMLTEAGAGFVCAAGDSRGLAQAVAHLAALSPQDRAKLGAAGRAYGERAFDRNRLLDTLEQWLKDSVQHGRRI
jgi:glycosyltransferase involved in cell wall biosynthesis